MEIDRVVVMRFDTSEEIVEFLLRHKNLELHSKSNRNFLVVETEKNKEPEYETRIEATFICKNGELIVPTLNRYRELSKDAQTIIDSIEDKNIKIQIGKIQKETGINIDKELYYEILHFAIDIGLGYCRYDVEDGEQVEIYMIKGSPLCIR